MAKHSGLQQLPGPRRKVRGPPYPITSFRPRAAPPAFHPFVPRCGICGPGLLPNGNTCSTDSDCESGCCDGDVTVSCRGTCKRKAYDGETFPYNFVSGGDLSKYAKELTLKQGALRAKEMAHFGAFSRAPPAVPYFAHGAHFAAARAALRSTPKATFPWMLELIEAGRLEVTFYLELIWRYVLHGAAEADKAAAVVDREEMPLELSEARLVHRTRADFKGPPSSESRSFPEGGGCALQWLPLLSAVVGTPSPPPPAPCRKRALMMALAEAGMLVVGALTPVVRRHNWRPRVSATGTAPAKLAWLVLSTLAATVSGLSYQIVQSGTCESAGGVDISSNLAECTAAGEALSIAWTWNLEYDSPHVPSGCIVTSTGSALYFNPRDTDKACGTATSSTWYCVCRFTTAYSPSPPQPPPRAPDYGCWRVSDKSESCTARCSNLGGCSEQDMYLHATEIDSHAEVVALFEGITGEDCRSTGAGYTWDSVPLMYGDGGSCYYKKTPSSADDFNCGASNSVAYRLCWCSSCASPPPFQPGLVPPAPPPPSYVKLDEDGECQGWYIQKAGNSPQACQDLCDQSINCGATTFMQSSGDVCESRLCRLTPPPPSHPSCSRQRPNGPPQSQQPMRPKSRRSAPFCRLDALPGPIGLHFGQTNLWASARERLQQQQREPWLQLVPGRLFADRLRNVEPPLLHAHLCVAPSHSPAAAAATDAAAIAALSPSTAAQGLRVPNRAVGHVRVGGRRDHSFGPGRVHGRRRGALHRMDMELGV